MIWMLLTYILLGFYGFQVLEEPTVALPPAMFVSLIIMPMWLAKMYRVKLR